MEGDDKDAEKLVKGRENVDPVVDKEERNQAVDNAAQEIDDEDPEGFRRLKKKNRNEELRKARNPAGCCRSRLFNRFFYSCCQRYFIAQADTVVATQVPLD